MNFDVKTVDFCRPMEIIDEEIGSLKKMGYIPIEQIGYDLLFANPNDPKNTLCKEDIIRMSESHLEKCKISWECLKDIRGM